MKILVLNCGSSSIKYKLYNMEDILENIKKHLENTSKEELEKEWNKMHSKNKSDLNVFDYIEYIKNNS